MVLIADPLGPVFPNGDKLVETLAHVWRVLQHPEVMSVDWRNRNNCTCICAAATCYERVNSPRSRFLDFRIRQRNSTPGFSSLGLGLHFVAIERAVPTVVTSRMT